METKNYPICTDEAYLCLTQPRNKHNNRIWAAERPFDWAEQPLQNTKVLVWLGISAKKNYGHYFLKKAIKQHNYLTILQDFFWKKHLDIAEYEKYYFQQDGTYPHKAIAVQEWLTSKFSTKFIGGQVATTVPGLKSL